MTVLQAAHAVILSDPLIVPKQLKGWQVYHLARFWQRNPSMGHW